jgi:hypothetical protein
VPNSALTTTPRLIHPKHQKKKKNFKKEKKRKKKTAVVLPVPWFHHQSGCSGSGRTSGWCENKNNEGPQKLHFFLGTLFGSIKRKRRGRRISRKVSQEVPSSSLNKQKNMSESKAVQQYISNSNPNSSTS